MVRYILKYSLDCLTRADGDSTSGATNTKVVYRCEPNVL
jgi:hypothetical protein